MRTGQRDGAPDATSPRAEPPSSPPPTTPITTTPDLPPPTIIEDTTTTSPPETTVAPTGSANTCPAGERLDDVDGDSWGECAADEIEVNTWAAQAAAEASGLPVGTPCVYPPSVVSGATATVTCDVVNADASEGAWSFVIASDSSVSSSASYVETKVKPPPATPPPATRAPRPPVTPEPQTDPRFATCKAAKAQGYGPYSSDEPEYDWYDDRDGDGVVCE